MICSYFYCRGLECQTHVPTRNPSSFPKKSQVSLGATQVYPYQTPILCLNVSRIYLLTPQRFLIELILLHGKYSSVLKMRHLNTLSLCRFPDTAWFLSSFCLSSLILLTVYCCMCVVRRLDHLLLHRKQYSENIIG